MLRRFATLGGVGLAGLALIGAGATATFTQDTTSSQAVQVGTMNVVLSDGVTTAQTLSLPVAGPVGSTFTMGPNLVTITNLGNIPATEIRVRIGATTGGGAAGEALRDQAYACLYSGPPSGPGSLVFNVPLNDAVGYGAFAVGTQTVPPPDYYTLVLYAGGAYTGCGETWTGVSGGTFNALKPYVGPVPTFGANPAAASLTNPAQGGSVTVSVTVSYEG